MELSTSGFLLDRPELVETEAPWCVGLDVLELAVLLVTQPWLDPNGQRRSDIQQRLASLDLPVGPVYYQRVNRTVALLEARGQVRAVGAARSSRFVATAEGFAALVLNLQVLRDDPTLDAREFELKRAVVTICALILDHFADRDHALEPGSDLARFFERVEALELWGRPVLTEPVIRGAFDLAGLIAVQRRAVETRLEQALAERDRARAVVEAVRGARAEPASAAARTPQPGRELDPRAVDEVRVLAAGEIPELAAAVAVERYRCYLEYLDRISALLSLRLRAVDPALFRHRAAAGGR